VVAVTGAGQGIGPAIVRGLSEPGARVFARDIDLDALAVVRCVPGIAMATLDLTDRAAAVAWVREVNGQAAARSTRWCLRRAAYAGRAADGSKTSRPMVRMRLLR
jgi:NAD(P)-dependent dehydrogenase (short-subunit alcohol dehydrogenase family)